MTGPTNRFTGQVAIVTAAASGIGRALVRRLAAEGASVVAADIDDAGLQALAAETPGVVPVRADVTVEDDVAATVATAVDRFGRLDLGFGVAGGARGGPLTELTEADWSFTIGLSLTGMYLQVKHQSRQMLAQGSGSMVLMSSLNAEVPMFGAAGYCVAKAGVTMLAKCAALELAPAGIRVNAIAPGLTETPPTAPLLGSPDVRAAFMARIPTGRPASPDEIAAAASWLASTDASYVTGTTLFVDGGWSLSGYPDLRTLLRAGSAS